MLSAVQRTEEAFAVVDSVKRARGFAFPGDSPLPWAALLGEDYTAMTTTLGSRAAKEVSTNPAWASMLVRLLSSIGVGEGDTVAVLISASFPSIALAALAAVHEFGAAPLIVSSLGASSYGANVREATWLDWESWVRDEEVLNIRSALVTAGGEQDGAMGMPSEGITWLTEAAHRNGADLKSYSSLAHAISARMTLFAQYQLKAVINIGGGHTSLGGCRHAASLPIGLWEEVPECRCSDRGVLTRIAQKDIPVIHFLQVRRLAAKYGLDPEPGSRYTDNGNITTVMHVRSRWVFVAISVIIVSMVISGRRPL
jgi:poly-gamma-glutamate system protein